MTTDRPYRRAHDRGEALPSWSASPARSSTRMVVPALVRVLTEDRIRLDSRFGRGDVGIDRRIDERRGEAA